MFNYVLLEVTNQIRFWSHDFVSLDLVTVCDAVKHSIQLDEVNLIILEKWS